MHVSQILEVGLRLNLAGCCRELQSPELVPGGSGAQAEKARDVAASLHVVGHVLPLCCIQPGYNESLNDAIGQCVGPL